MIEIHYVVAVKIDSTAHYTVNIENHDEYSMARRTKKKYIKKHNASIRNAAMVLLAYFFFLYFSEPFGE